MTLFPAGRTGSPVRIVFMGAIPFEMCLGPAAPASSRLCLYPTYCSRRTKATCRTLATRISSVPYFTATVAFTIKFVNLHRLLEISFLSSCPVFLFRNLNLISKFCSVAASFTAASIVYGCWRINFLAIVSDVSPSTKISTSWHCTNLSVFLSGHASSASASMRSAYTCTPSVCF